MPRERQTQVIAKFYADGRYDEQPCQMTLKDMQKFVGGIIQIIPSWLPRRSLVVNDEGFLQDLPQNHRATELAHPQTLIIDAIRGNALLITS